MSIFKFVRRSVKTAVVALIIVTTSACSGSDEVVEESPYRDAFDSAYASAVSDFERKVLHDYVITDAEYSEAQQLYAECLAEYGIFGSVNDEGQSEHGLPIGMEVELGLDILGECSQGTVSIIETLYLEIKKNPEGVDADQAIVDCMILNNLVDRDYTKAMYFEDVMSDDPSFDLDDGRFWNCVDAPLVPTP